MYPNDLEYFEQRAAAERDLAKDAASESIAEIHEELARQYDALASEDLRPRLRAVGEG